MVLILILPGSVPGPRHRSRRRERYRSSCGGIVVAGRILSIRSGEGRVSIRVGAIEALDLVARPICRRGVGAGGQLRSPRARAWRTPRSCRRGRGRRSSGRRSASGSGFHGDSRRVQPLAPAVELGGGSGEGDVAGPRAPCAGTGKAGSPGGRSVWRVEDQQHRRAAAEEDVARSGAGHLLQPEHVTVEACGGVEVGRVERGLKDAGGSRGHATGLGEAGGVAQGPGLGDTATAAAGAAAVRTCAFGASGVRFVSTPGVVILGQLISSMLRSTVLSPKPRKPPNSVTTFSTLPPGPAARP